MDTKGILVVDDEKSICFTLSLALETLNVPVETAGTGEEALALLSRKSFAVMLLDLKLPGISGMDVLRRVSTEKPGMKVIVITAYGIIDMAVEAMKLGAVDFLVKPFFASDIRQVVGRVLKEAEEERRGDKYDVYMDLARQRISQADFDAAGVYLHKAISINPNRPEAFNYLGGLLEVRGKRMEAEKNYRVALELQPSYEPALQNLERITSRPYSQMGIVWEDYSAKR